MYLDDAVNYQPGLIIRIGGTFTEDKQEIKDKLKKGLLATAKKTNAIILTDGSLPFIDESFENIPCIGFANVRNIHSEEFKNKLKENLEAEREERIRIAVKRQI